MGRKSSIKRLDPKQRQFLEKLLREDRLTLSEIIDAVRRKFPTEAPPSRSAVHRYKLSFEEMTGRMREIEAASKVLVAELGEDVDEKSGALLAQAVTTLATDAALRAHGNEKVSIEEVGKIARAARAAAQTSRVTRQEREAIEARARERVLKEQAANLQSVVKEGGLTEAQAQLWRSKILGVDSD